MQRAAAIFEKKYGADHSKTQDSLQLVSISRRGGSVVLLTRIAGQEIFGNGKGCSG